MSLLDANMVGASFLPLKHPKCLIVRQGTLSNIDLYAHHHGLVDPGRQYMVGRRRLII
jgi:hypothetical protein